MASVTSKPSAPPALPDHAQLPESDGTFVKNFQEHPQSVLLTDSIGPVLRRRHPDGRFCIGQDSGIYWRLPAPPEPLYRGAVSTDWYYVPNVPSRLGGRMRRSYVTWQEKVPPLIILEFVSGDGREERDRTPGTGKFSIYENVVKPAYYGIYEVDPGRIEMHQTVGTHFQPLAANERGRFPIEPLGVELGIWQGEYQGADLPWVRWWDADGQLLPTGHELAEIEADRAEQEARRAERLAAQLRALGIEPEE